MMETAMQQESEQPDQKQPDYVQERERLNAMRVAGGLLVIIGLLLYFFHLAEARMGGATMGVLAAAFAVVGSVLLFVGWWKLRELR